MATLSWVRRFMWVVPLTLGLVFVAAGAYMISEGRDAKTDVRNALVAEQVVTPDDAAIPNAPVVDAATAQAQSDVIQKHALAAADGKTYAELGRYMAADGGYTSDPEKALLGADGKPVANPLRNTALQGVTLRTALNLAVMGFKVSDLVMGIGAFMIVVGASHVLLLAPVLFWARESTPVSERAAAKPTIRAPAPSGG